MKSNRRQTGTYLRWLRGGVLITLMMFSLACSAKILPVHNPPQQVIHQTKPTTLLPGQKVWNKGVSSFLFGTNDTQEWYKNNVETAPSIQNALKDAHFSLMRTFFFDKSLADNHPTTDAEIELRLKTIENSGMSCLGVLHNIFDVTFDTHVVTYAGPRCLIYEFGNESDYQNVPITSYLKQWNTVIPLLRKINPQAKFIGPVTYTDQGNHNFMSEFLVGVKASGILPDAVSFHWYPCYQDTESSCLSKASSYGMVARGVEEMVQNILSKRLPVGITEWNFDPSLTPPAYGDDPAFINQFSTVALQSMIQANVSFACQFDAASYSSYGHIDMFDVLTNQARPQFYVVKKLIQQYRPTPS